MSSTKAGADVELLVLDVDGVLTDGTINLSDDGTETKRFHARDGYAIRLWMSRGFPIAIITGRAGEALKHRMRGLGVPDELIYQGSTTKPEHLQEIFARTGIDGSRAAYLADDWPDYHAMQMTGYPMAVADAEPEILDVAQFVTKRNGGHGAVREAVAHLLTLKGMYEPPEVSPLLTSG